jgi:hypothetical protein
MVSKENITEQKRLSEKMEEEVEDDNQAHLPKVDGAVESNGSKQEVVAMAATEVVVIVTDMKEEHNPIRSPSADHPESIQEESEKEEDLGDMESVRGPSEGMHATDTQGGKIESNNYKYESLSELGKVDQPIIKEKLS